MTLLEPDLLAEVTILFPTDRTKAPQLFCTKPDETDTVLIQHLLNGIIGCAVEFGRQNGIMVHGQLGTPLCPVCGGPGVAQPPVFPCQH